MYEHVQNTLIVLAIASGIATLITAISADMNYHNQGHILARRAWGLFGLTLALLICVVWVN